MKLRYIRLRVWAILFAVALGVIIILNYSGGSTTYQSSAPVTDSLLIASYPDLYEAITQRNAQQLKPFLSHDHPEVRQQAWRALANTPVDSLEPFLDLAWQQNSKEAWFGISQQELTDKQLRSLEQSMLETSSQKSGIARVLGQQGDEQSLQFLLDQLDNHGLENQYHLALAVGRLVTEFDLSRQQQIRVIQQAFNSDNYDVTRAYLYGWYRGDSSRLTSTARDTLYNRWQLQGTGISRNVDQYVNKIMPERTTYDMTIYYNGEQLLDSEAQLSYELASSVQELELNDQNSLAAKILLTNTNPHVQVRALQSLTDKITQDGDLYEYISETMIPDATLAPVVWLQAVQTALTVDPDIAEDHLDRLAAIPKENRYLMPEVLAIYEQIESTDAYLQRIASIVDEAEARPAMFALQRLNQYWDKLSDDQQTSQRIQQIRSIVFNALEMGDRGVTYRAQALLQNEQLFNKDDFGRINRSLQAFSMPGDIEVYQAFGSLYKNRFEKQAARVVDSLSSLGYTSLNRSLANAGWEVEASEGKQSKFRLPDWDRLWQLGRHPVLTLRTEKGIIEMELNTLSAPATVAMIDSLNEAAKYKDVPFHRVVPNFVIQGGDYQRMDGFGGPDFVIPTEASEQGFVRGAVGIASAGADTEGSQYFIMHQWKPHLNGSYTRFGRVIEGMDVVDEIVEGDKVLSTTWF